MQLSVIGAGFAAITALKTLRKTLPNADITLIAPETTFVFYPSLIWIPAELRSREDVTVDITPLLKKLQVHHHVAAATGVSADGRLVTTTAGEVENDGLIIASGGRFLQKLPGIEHAITPCAGVDAAEQIKQKLDAMQGGSIAIGFGGNPKEPSAVRGGPMFEMLFGIDRLLRQQGRRDQFEITFFNPAKRPGNRLGEKAVDRLLERMEKLDIHTELGAKPVSFSATEVETERTRFAADLILFMPGMTGPAWLADTQLPQSEGGLIQADEHARVAGMERVYVAGDSGSYPGPEWAPKQAHMADLIAKAAARNLAAEINGQPADHRFKWELVCIMDMLDRGVLVFRNEKHQFITPPCRLLHWAKRGFEQFYLRGLKG